MPLKYLFTARYANGKVYYQQANDASIFEPEKRSGYYDVLKLEEESPLIEFTLRSEKDTYSVNLTDGTFEINGAKVQMHEEGGLSNFKLIYFRRHTHTYAVSPIEATREKSHGIVFRFGWQATKDGKNYQHVMQVD